MKIHPQSLNTQLPLHPQQGHQPSFTRIIRAVASSTAIETGQSIQELETQLQAQDSKYQQLSLASL